MGFNAIDFWALRTHVVFGVVAVSSGPGAMLTRKGGRWHRRWGSIFFWSMLVVLIAAVPLAYVRHDAFLFYLSVVVFYLTFSGYRVLFRKHRGYRGTILDWSGAVVTGIASVAMIQLGFRSLSRQQGDMGLVEVVFGALVAILAGADIQEFLRPPRGKRAWWFSHMGKMLGAYVAAITAVSVVQLQTLPTTIRWLWPTALGLPGIFLWLGYYGLKFRALERPRAPLAARVPD